MLDMGFVQGRHEDRPAAAGRASVAAVLGHHAAGDRGPCRQDPHPAGARRGDAGSRHRREDRPERLSGAAEGQEALADRSSGHARIRADGDLHPHQARRQQARRRSREGRHRRPRHPRQQEPGGPAEGARRVPVRPGRRPRRHRHRRPRHPCRRHQPCRELRPAGGAGELRAPHRPHRACGQVGHRRRAGRSVRARQAALDREAHRPDVRRAEDRLPGAMSTFRPSRRRTTAGHAARTGPATPPADAASARSRAAASPAASAPASAAATVRQRPSPTSRPTAATAGAARAAAAGPSPPSEDGSFAT